MDKSSTKNKLNKYLFTKTVDIKRKTVDQNTFINNDNVSRNCNT